MHRTSAAERLDYLKRFEGATAVSVYGSLNPLTVSPAKFSRLFLRSATPGSLFSRLGALTYGTQASLFRAIWIGVASGFHDIVLVGIDLILEEGYGAPQPSSSKARGPVIDQRHLHDTAKQRYETEVPLVQTIEELARELLTHSHARLWISGAQSLLSTALPIFDWSLIQYSEKQFDSNLDDGAD